MRDPGLAGIGRLLRENPDYRRLWLAQVVSQAGDWVSHIAVVTLLLKLTGAGTVVAYSLILRMLPSVFVSPIAGVLVDRLNRKTILIATDVLRALVVPCYLIADRAELVPLVYAVIVVQVSMSAFFEPARQAVLPSIVRGEHLLSANALSSATWSLMLSLGSALGGVLIAWLGLRAAFLFDAATYLLSAALLARMRVPRRSQVRLRSVRDVVTDLVEGLSYMRRERAVSSLVMVKTGVGLAGGMVLLFTVLGERVFTIPEAARALLAGGGERDPTRDGALVIGALFCARGVGTAIGPFVGRAISGYHEPAMRRLIGFGFLQAAVFFVAFGFAPGLAVALPLVVVAHLGTSINWVFSTVLLQLTVPDALRGRVFSAELLLFTLVFCASTWTTAYALDQLGTDPRLLVGVCGGALVIPGVLWHVLSRSRRGPASPDAPPRSRGS